MSIETRKTSTGAARYIARVRSGEQLVASKSFHRKKDAEAWEREQKHLLTTGRPIASRVAMTLDQLIARFQHSRLAGNPHTINTDDNNLAAIPRAIRARQLNTVQASDIREHLLAQLASGKAASTVARARTTLSALFTYAESEGFLQQPPRTHYEDDPAVVRCTTASFVVRNPKPGAFS